MAVTISDYKKEEAKFLSSVDKVLNNLNTKLSSLSITEKTFDDSIKTITLENNTVYKYTGKNGVTNLHITYPEGNIISTVLFYTARSGKISITFKSGTKFVGSGSYEFFPAENWELNIHNGRVVGSQLF